MHTYQYSCNYCNHFVETSGPWPYYGKHGETEPIYGLTARIYCPACDKEKDYIIVEYKTPLNTLDDVWLRSTPKKTRMTCYKCKSPVFLTLPEGSVRCPRCKKGVFESFEPMEDLPSTNPAPSPKNPLVVRQGGKWVIIKMGWP